MFNDILDKQLKIDAGKCTKCGVCIEVCTTSVLKAGEDGIPYMLDLENKGEWDTCWECHKCLAYCPEGALSICGKDPQDSQSVSDMPTEREMAALIACRRSCRHFKYEQIDKGEIERLLHIVGNLPTGGNEQLVEYTVFDDLKEFEKFKLVFYEEFAEKTRNGIYPHRWGADIMNEIITEWENGEESVFRGAPHMAIPHAKIGRGEWVFDTGIALSYLELLMNCAGLGTLIMSGARSFLEILPGASKLLNIPDDHYIGCFLAFGKPALRYHRGVQRQDALKINRVYLA
jgi:nitroreductase/NAD-dependent dihydropyrimidine dehydrogenase PreA subunit